MKRGQISRILGELEHDGTLDAGQRRVVEDRLLAGLFPVRDRAGLFVTVISVLGALLIGVGLLFYLADNWEHIATVWKLAIICGGLLVIHHFGFALAEPPGRHPAVGRLLTALGVLCFGGALALIAAIYDLQSAYESNLVLVWWLLSVPLLFLNRCPAILTVLVVLFAIWLCWHTGIWLDRAGLHGDCEWTAAFGLLGLATGALLRALTALARVSRFRELELPLRLFASPPVLVALYALSFREPFVGVAAPGADATVFLPALIVAGAALLLLLPALRFATARADAGDTGVILAVTVILLIALHRAPGIVYVLANAALFIGVFVLILRGVNRGMPLYINLGVVTFLVLVMTRYFEYLADRVDAFPMFIGAGLLLIGVGVWLEKRRRVLIQRARGQPS